MQSIFRVISDDCRMASQWGDSVPICRRNGDDSGVLITILPDFEAQKATPSCSLAGNLRLETTALGRAWDTCAGGLAHAGAMV
jgi:hypothetical protein